MLRYVNPIEVAHIPGGQAHQPWLFPRLVCTPHGDGFHGFATADALQTIVPFPLLLPGAVPSICQPRAFALRVPPGAPPEQGTVEFHYTHHLSIFQWLAQEPIHPVVGTGAAQEFQINGETLLCVRGRWAETATADDRRRLDEALQELPPADQSEFVRRYLTLAQLLWPPCRWDMGKGHYLFAERGPRALALCAPAEFERDELARTLLSMG